MSEKVNTRGFFCFFNIWDVGEIIIATFVDYYILARSSLEYFCNVLGALEVEPSETMTHIESLLKASPEE